MRFAGVHLTRHFLSRALPGGPMVEPARLLRVKPMCERRFRIPTSCSGDGHPNQAFPLVRARNHVAALAPWRGDVLYTGWRGKVPPAGHADRLWDVMMAEMTDASDEEKLTFGGDEWDERRSEVIPRLQLQNCPHRTFLIPHLTTICIDPVPVYPSLASLVTDCQLSPCRATRP